MRSLAHSVRITGNGRSHQFGPKLGLLTEFGGGEWFALDLLHQTVLDFLNLQIIANNPQTSPQNRRLLLLKDTGEVSPRTEICCQTEPFSDREMPSVLRKLNIGDSQVSTAPQAIRYEKNEGLAGNESRTDPRFFDNPDNMAEMGTGFPIH